MKIVSTIVICFILISSMSFSKAGQESYVPKEGFVPNEETAIRIAEAIWIPIYGKAKIESEKPFTATLSNGVWTVSGTLPKGYVGGVAIADISKESGCILRVIHEK